MIIAPKPLEAEGVTRVNAEFAQPRGQVLYESRQVLPSLSEREEDPRFTVRPDLLTAVKGDHTIDRVQGQDKGSDALVHLRVHLDENLLMQGHARRTPP